MAKVKLAAGHRLFGTTIMDYYVLHRDSGHVLGLFLTVDNCLEWINMQQVPGEFEYWSFKDRPLRMSLDAHKGHH